MGFCHDLLIAWLGIFCPHHTTRLGICHIEIARYVLDFTYATSLWTNGSRYLATACQFGVGKIVTAILLGIKLHANMRLRTCIEGRL